jgi:hypothetical protein
MTHASDRPEDRFDQVVEAFRDSPNITFGSKGKKVFGATALKVNGKIFAMLSSKRVLVVKLPKARVDMLIGSGVGERFDPGYGRVMKEWLAVKQDSDIDWHSLVREALAFVGETA